jgi:hypothetical protein
MSGNEGRKISSLRDLPRDIAPPRDLWQGIEARIAAEKSSASADASAGATAGGSAGAPAELLHRRAGRAGGLRVWAAAAVFVALAVGIWIGRVVLPVAPPAMGAGTGLSASNTAANGQPEGRPTGGAGTNASNMLGGEPGAFHAAYVMGPKYIGQRAALMKDLEARLAALPPDSQAKVAASLQAISDSKRDLETELGKDPSNALLQELLVNTYQDEMRVLTAVHEAGSTGEGI